MHELPSRRGVCHLLESLATKSTQRRTAAEIEQECTLRGMVLTATNSREAIMYRADALRGSADFAMSLIADAVLAPRFLSEEIADAKQTIQFQLEDLNENAPMLIQELLHEAAFGKGTPLGQSQYADLATLQELDVADLEVFRRRRFHPNQMVIAGAGIDHAELVRLSDQFFGHLPHEARPDPPLDTAYRGGLATSTFVNPPTNPGPELAHAIMAFPSVGWTNRDVIPVCVLDTMLGGGSSFSAGGPGKGLYTRLYREVLQRHSWVESTNAFSLQFNDQGLFGIYSSAAVADAEPMLGVMMGILDRLASTRPSEEEVARARNQLRSSVMMNLEERGILCEDIGRQVLSLGKRMSADEVCSRIAAVTAGDLQRVARELMSKPFTMATLNVPNAEEYYRTCWKHLSDSSARHGLGPWAGQPRPVVAPSDGAPE